MTPTVAAIPSDGEGNDTVDEGGGFDRCSGEIVRNCESGKGIRRAERHEQEQNDPLTGAGIRARFKCCSG